MKVIVSKEEDALLLLERLRNTEHDMAKRFKQQSPEHEHVVAEVMRGVNYVLIDWLVAQGFKVT